MQPDRREERERHAAHPGAEVAHGRGGDVASRRARRRAARRRPRTRPAPSTAASGSRGRCTATNTAASAHAATRTTASARPGPERHAITDERRRPRPPAMATTASATDAGCARRPRRTLGHIVADAGELQGLDVVEAGGHGHSDRRTTAGRVRGSSARGDCGDEVHERAAPRARADDAEHRPGRGSRHAELVGDGPPHEPADDEPERDPDDSPTTATVVACHATVVAHLPTREPERLQHREVPAAPPHRRHEREADRDQGDDRDEHRQRDREPVDPVAPGRSPRAPSGVRRARPSDDRRRSRRTASARSTPGRSAPRGSSRRCSSPRRASPRAVNTAPSASG